MARGKWEQIAGLGRRVGRKKKDDRSHWCVLWGALIAEPVYQRRRRRERWISIFIQFSLLQRHRERERRDRLLGAFSLAAFFLDVLLRQMGFAFVAENLPPLPPRQVILGKCFRGTTLVVVVVCSRRDVSCFLLSQLPPPTPPTPFLAPRWSLDNGRTTLRQCTPPPTLPKNQ